MKKGIHRTVGGLLVTLFAVSACTNTGPVTDEQKVERVLEKLNESSEQAVAAQRELALTADAKNIRELSLRKRLLTDTINFDFYGDVEDILKEVAIKYGYGFEIYGKRPPQRVNVNVFVKRKPVIEVLKQIGYAETERLDIVVKRDVIELHYK